MADSAQQQPLQVRLVTSSLEANAAVGVCLQFSLVTKRPIAWLLVGIQVASRPGHGTCESEPALGHYYQADWCLHVGVRFQVTLCASQPTKGRLHPMDNKHGICE